MTPDIDDLPDRLDEWAKWSRTNNYETPRSSDLRAAAAELRRLRQRDAALTRLLDAVGKAEVLRWWADSGGRGPVSVTWLRRIAAAVEGIDREGER